MKKFIMSLVGMLLSFSILASAGPDAFPWGSELPFPWKGIQGTWTTNIDGAEAYVVFEVVRYETNSSKELKIRILDSETCQVIAQGRGYENERIVTAFVAGANRVSARVTVHAFRQSDVNPALKYRLNSQVTIMSVAPVKNGQRKTFELEKISTDIRPQCL